MPDGGGKPELRSGSVDGRMLGGWGRMLGGGGGVRALGGASSAGASGMGFAGRERTGGGGGPEERPNTPGADGCREGGIGLPGAGTPSTGVGPPSAFDAFGALGSGVPA